MKQDTINGTCPITGTLSVYSGWGANQNDPDPDKAKLRDIQHLFNRMTLGANKTDIDWALNMTPSQVVDRLVHLATEQINGVLTIPNPGLNAHPWGDRRPFMVPEIMAECNSNWELGNSLKRELSHGLIGNNHPLNPQYTPSNGTKTVLDQEIDRAKRFKYKMAWFWSNHFVVHEDSSFDANGMMWYKYILLHNALGNFKEFAKDVGLSQVMLSYLDAGKNYYQQDPNWEPNENYARELLELFTMGVANGASDDYTLYDIEQISKVFSGWRDEHWSPRPQLFREFTFQPNHHDWNTKTIFGVTYTPTPDPSIDITTNWVAWAQHLGLDPNTPAGCNNEYRRYTPITDNPHCFVGDKNTFEIKNAYDEYEKVHDIIFGDFTGPEAYNQANMDARKQRIARFICRKIYTEFVYQEVDANGEAIINDLANIFKVNWEITPVLSALFKSEHFYHTTVRGAQIKSHLGSFFGMLTTLGAEYNSDYFLTQQFFSSSHYDPNKPYGYIIKSIPVTEQNTGRFYLDIQWSIGSLGHYLFRPPNVSGFPGHRTWINEFSFLKLGHEIGNMIDWRFNDTRISTKHKWREFLVDLTNNSSDPEVITRAVVDHFIVIDLAPEQIERAVIAFKWTIPSNYFDDGTWHLNFQTDWTFNQYKSLLRFIVKQPEFYLT